MTNLTPLPFNTPGKVFRSPMPFGYFDYGETLIDEYMAAGINVVVMLVSDAEANDRARRPLREVYAENGFEVIHFPIVDFDIPRSPKTMDIPLKAAISAVEGGKNIVVHCYAGLGRAGMFLGVMARRLMEMEGAEAIEWLRGFVPGAVQTQGQARVVIEDGGQ